jgi:branched-chain amino acid transport system ATP-binding protein
VRENLKVALYTVEDRAGAESRLKIARELFPILREREQQKARTLAGGEQRMLSLAIALMLQPQLLLLDEPSLGLSPKMVENVMEAIREVQRTLGTAVIVAEQNVKQVLQLAQRVYVMKMGRIILEESAKELRQRHDWWDLF